MTDRDVRLEVPMGSVLCEHCTAACCRYLALPIDKPRSRRDYDDLRWYLMHAGVTVFVEEGDWFVQYQTTCKNVRGDNLCGVYETRPEICAEYEPIGCDYSGDDYTYDELFTHHKQIEEYYHNRTGKRLGEPTPPKKRVPARRKSTKKRKSA